MIHIPNTGRFRAAEFIQFHRNVISIIDSHDATALGVKPQRDALAAQTDSLEDEFKKPAGNELTARLIELDLKRDRALLGISTVVRGYINHHAEATAQAANRLEAAISNYGSELIKLRYQQETAVIESILGDFASKPELAAAVTALHLGEWTGHLAAVNTEFDGVYVQRSQQTAGDPSQVLALRATVTEAWETLGQHLTAHATLTPTTAHTQAISEINSLIDDYNNAVAIRPDTEPEAPPAPAPA